MQGSIHSTQKNQSHSKEAGKRSGCLSTPPENLHEFVRKCEIGLDNRDRIAGWHGTSMNAIELALRSGAVPASQVQHAQAAPGHLFFYPPLPTDDASGKALEFQMCGRGGAMAYASGNARRDYLIEVAGLDHTNREHRALVFETVEFVRANPRSSKSSEALRNLGVPAQRIEEVRLELPRRGGFLIGIDRQALVEYAPSHGDIPGEDQKIFIPTGLPWGLIAALEPLGDAEWDLFERVQKSLAKDAKTGS